MYAPGSHSDARTVSDSSSSSGHFFRMVASSRIRSACRLEIRVRLSVIRG